MKFSDFQNTLDNAMTMLKLAVVEMKLANAQTERQDHIAAYENVDSAYDKLKLSQSFYSDITF